MDAGNGEGEQENRVLRYILPKNNISDNGDRTRVAYGITRIEYNVAPSV